MVKMRNEKDFLNWNEYKILESTADFINSLETFKRDYCKISFYSIFKKLF